MYRVVCKYDGTTYTIHDPQSDELRIFNDEVVTEDNEPGSFTFAMAADHPYIDKVQGLQSEIIVYEDDEEIFRGRVIDDGEDIRRGRKFTCEGELAFLFDSIQPRCELHDISPLNFFSLLLDEHNTQVQGGPIDKTFHLGVVTVTDSNDSLYRYTNRETTLDCIREKIIERLGGHLRVRVENGIRYLDLLADIDVVSDQPIQLGENLLDYAADTDYTWIATACIPLGEHLDETEIDALDAYLDIKSVNDGKDYLTIPEAVQRHGFICKVVHFDNYTVPSRLKTAGQKWLTDGQYAALTLELTAVDLHALGYDVQPIRACRRVRVISEPHGMDRYFIVSQRTYHLTRPDADKVTFGQTIQKLSYTSSNHSNVTATTDDIKASIATEKAATDSQFETERQNVSNMLNLATHGYVVMDPNDGPERILIMETNNIATAKKLWKWDLNGLGYSKNGINGPWGVAITMDGSICADYIVTGTLNADIIKAGILQDAGGNTAFNLQTGKLTMKKGSINIGNGKFSVSETGSVVAKDLDVQGGKIALAATSADDSRVYIAYGDYSFGAHPKAINMTSATSFGAYQADLLALKKDKASSDYNATLSDSGILSLFGYTDSNNSANGCFIVMHDSNRAENLVIGAVTDTDHYASYSAGYAHFYDRSGSTKDEKAALGIASGTGYLHVSDGLNGYARIDGYRLRIYDNSLNLMTDIRKGVIELQRAGGGSDVKLETSSQGGRITLNDPSGGNYALHCNDSSMYVVNGAAKIYLERSSGNITAAAFNTNSSRTVKKDISPMGETMFKLLQLHPVNFRYKTDADDAEIRHGLIAEDTAEVLPDVVVMPSKNAPEGTVPGIDYSKLTPYLLKGIQELHARVRALETK